MLEQVTPQQRTLNIIQAAVNIGFEVDYKKDFMDCRSEAARFLLENISQKKDVEEHCELGDVGCSQIVDWNDGMGYSIFFQGNIVNYHATEMFPSDHKVVHTRTVDSLGQVVALYFIVGVTPYNTPKY